MIQIPSAEGWADHLLAPPPRIHLVSPGDSNPSAAVGALGFRTYSARLDEVADKADLMRVLASHLELPDYFGHNWDALFDCLSDFGWDPAPGYAIVLEGIDALAQAAWPDFVEFINILIDATLRMHRYDRNLHVFALGEGARSAVRGVAGTSRVCDHFESRLSPEDRA